jgi:hypothetical protein
MDAYCYPKRTSTFPLPSNGCSSIVERLCHWNVFTEPLPNIGHMRHNNYVISIISMEVGREQQLSYLRDS